MLEHLNVVINTYNDSDFIDKIKTNYRLIKKLPISTTVLIVSDGSNETFVKLLRQNFPPDELLILEVNVGVHNARMAAVKNFSDGHCLFIDSDDDLIDPFCGHDVGVYDFKGYNLTTLAITHEPGMRNVTGSLSSQIIRNQVSGVLWNKIYSVQDIKTVPDIHLRNGEDYFTNLWLRDAIDKMPYFMTPITTYNLRPDSLSKKPSPYKYRHLVKMICFLLWHNRIDFMEAVILFWHLVIKNFVRSIKNTNNKRLELFCFFGIFKWW